MKASAANATRRAGEFDRTDVAKMAEDVSNDTPSGSAGYDGLAYARIFRATFPATSVSRKSRPLKEYVSFS